MTTKRQARDAALDLLRSPAARLVSERGALHSPGATVTAQPEPEQQPEPVDVPERIAGQFEPIPPIPAYPRERRDELGRILRGRS